MTQKPKAGSMRRTFLKTVGVGVTAVPLAGCLTSTGNGNGNGNGGSEGPIVILSLYT